MKLASLASTLVPACLASVGPKGFVLGCALAAGLFGCSSGLEGVDKRLSALQEEITKMQSQNDRLVERLDSVEARQAKSEIAAKASAPAPGKSERPSLKVVKVVPEDTSGMPQPQVGTQAPGDAADDPTPRPVIKLRGSEAKEGKDGKRRGDSSDGREGKGDT